MAAKDKSESEREVVETQEVVETVAETGVKTETGIRFEYPGEKYPDAWVEVPHEWLGEHAMRRDEALTLAEKYKNNDISTLAIALSVANSWGGIPGLDGKDPKFWKLDKVPLPVFAWLRQTVIFSLAAAYIVPKGS